MRADAVILNPHCNGGRGFRRWKVFVDSEAARRLGITEAPVFDGGGVRDAGRVRLELERWVRARLAEGRENFVAAGGDGTVHLALNALVAAGRGSWRLGAVGLGSSNDFHKPHAAAGRYLSGGVRCRLDFAAARPHDIGEVVLREISSKSYFAINASVGLTAEANHFFNNAGPAFRALKRVSAGAAITFAAVRGWALYRGFPLEVAAGNGARREVTVVNLGVVKNPHFSGSFRYDGPHPPDDGLFGAHLCESMGRLEALRVLSSLSRGKFSGLPKTWSARVPELELSAAAPFALETDGEVTRTRHARLRVAAREVLLCP